MGTDIFYDIGIQPKLKRLIAANDHIGDAR